MCDAAHVELHEGQSPLDPLQDLNEEDPSFPTQDALFPAVETPSVANADEDHGISHITCPDPFQSPSVFDETQTAPAAVAANAISKADPAAEAATTATNSNDFSEHRSFDNLSLLQAAELHVTYEIAAIASTSNSIATNESFDSDEAQKCNLDSSQPNQEGICTEPECRQEIHAMTVKTSRVPDHLGTDSSEVETQIWFLWQAALNHAEKSFEKSFEDSSTDESEGKDRHECRLCGQPCQKQCWSNTCCKSVATCFEITGRTCTRPLNHKGPHRCGAYHDDAIGNADCDMDSDDDSSGNPDKSNAKGKGRGKKQKEGRQS